MPSVHPEISTRLFSYHERRLEESERREVQDHLNECSTCAEELGTIRLIAAALPRAWRADFHDRCGCPSPEELTGGDANARAESARKGDRIGRHVETCVLCQRELDLVHLLRLELDRPTDAVGPPGLLAQIEGRLSARVRQESADTPERGVATPIRWFKIRLLVPVAVAAGLGAGVVIADRVWRQGRPTPVATEGQQTGTTEVPGRSPRAPTIVAKVEPVEMPGVPSSPVSGPHSAAAPPKPAGPSVVGASSEVDRVREGGRPTEVAGGPSARSTLPRLVPAKQAHELRVLILPIAERPGMRSAVARALQVELKTLQPSEREFPPDQSIENARANRRLSSLHGARYILGIDVTTSPSGYLVVLRVADGETGRIVAGREATASSEEALAAATTRLAEELRHELRRRP